MTLPLNPEIVACAYEYLRSTPPFRRWRLLPASEILFKVRRIPGCKGWHEVDKKGREVIIISRDLVGHTNNLMATVGHEMVHLNQSLRGERRAHNETFNRRAALVCRYHGFDPKEF